MDTGLRGNDGQERAGGATGPLQDGSGLRRNDERRSPDLLGGLLVEIVDLVCREGEPLSRLPQRGQPGQVAMLEQL